jgi:hypothetical protein
VYIECSETGLDRSYTIENNPDIFGELGAWNGYDHLGKEVLGLNPEVSHNFLFSLFLPSPPLLSCPLQSPSFLTLLPSLPLFPLQNLRLRIHIFPVTSFVTLNI